MNRFDKLISKYHFLKDGKIQKSFEKISFEDNKSICSILDYVCENHGYDALKPYFKQNLDSLLKEEFFERSKKISALIGVEYINRWAKESKDSIKNFSYSANFNECKKGINISGFQYVFDVMFEKFDPKEVNSVKDRNFQVGDSFIQLSYKSDDRKLDFKIHDSIKLSIDTKRFLKKLFGKTSYSDINLNPDDMLLKAKSEDLEAIIFFENISGSVNPSTKTDPLTGEFQCLVFLKFNKK